MLIKEIINEVASAGATSSGNIATLAFPMTPGTTHAQAIKAVDPFGKIFKNAKKKVNIVSNGDHSLSNSKQLKIIVKELNYIIKDFI